MSDAVVNRKFLSLLGLARNAGRVKAGEFSTEKSVKEGLSHLCIIASDASETTEKHFRDMCAYRKIPLIKSTADKQSLGNALGLEMRTSASVEDKGLADSLIRIMEGVNVNG